MIRWMRGVLLQLRLHVQQRAIELQQLAGQHVDGPRRRKTKLLPSSDCSAMSRKQS
jgi:hypothetical protein